MRDRIGALFGQAMVYGVAGVLSRASGLITFPILSKSMGIEQFGTLDYFMTLANLIAVLAMFGLESAAVRFYFAAESDEERFKQLSRVASMQCVPLLILLAASLGALALALPDSERPDSFLVALVLAQAFLSVLMAHFQYIMIWRKQRKDYLISTLGQTALTVVALVWVCHGRSATAVEVLAVLLVVRALSIAHGYWTVRTQFRITLDLSGVGPMVRYALPIGVVGTLAALLPLIERQAIASLLTAADLGTYAAAARLGMLIMLPIAAFQLVWVPFALSHHRDPAAEITYKAVLKLFTIGALVLALALTACADPLLRLLTSPEYYGARAVVFPICFGLVLKTIGDVVQVGIDISGRSHLKLYAFGFTTAASLLFVPLFTYHWGVVGAAWAGVLAFAVKATLEYHLGQSAHRLNWDGNRVLGISLLAAAIGGGAELIWSGQPIALALAAAGGAIVLAAFGWVGTLDVEERRQIRLILPVRQSKDVGCG